MQAIFRMGVPVTGKNVFPSNIQGLPTWYEIRVNKRRLHGADAALRPDGRAESGDLSEGHRRGQPGGWLIYDSTWPLDARLTRPDVTYLGIPLAEMCNAQFTGVRERILMKNIAYAGALAALLDMDTDDHPGAAEGEVLAEAGADGFEPEGDGPRLRLREGALRLSAADPPGADGRDEGRDPDRRQHGRGAGLRLRRRDGRRVVSDHAGHVADGGVQGVLPEVPASSRRRTENRFAILQAEDELAAIGMVIGASWAGARAFTPTSGPGISLMNEFIGLAYYAEVPAVMFDVQRTGPSTGMPTRTQQGDLMLCAYASHGDTRHICLYPADPREAFEFAVAVLRSGGAVPDAGVRAERSRHRHERLDGAEADVGRQLPARSRQGAVGRASSSTVKTFHRYLDMDGDGMPYRTLPGVHPKGAYFTRGSGHNRYGELHRRCRRVRRGARSHRSQDPERGAGRAGAARQDVSRAPRSGWSRSAAATRRASKRSICWPPKGSPSTTCASAGFRSATRCGAFLEAHEVNFIVEQNRDAQLRSLLMLETGVPVEKLESVRYYGGFPMSAHHVITGVKAKLEKAA